MDNTKKITLLTVGFLLLFSSGNIYGNKDYPAGSNSVQTQTKTKSDQTKTKSTKPVPKTKSKPVTRSTKPVPEKKIRDTTIIVIGTQNWAKSNLSVGVFRNGDSIPEAKTYKEWVAAGESGKPAWCYYNNNPAIGQKYGRLYNWYAVNDPRGLAPSGWVLPSDADWAKLTNFLGGSGAAGTKLKSLKGWIDGNNGSNESGFNGLPGGYRVENGLFQNLGSIGTWWSSTESKTLTAYDHYLMQGGSMDQSSTPKQRGESVRCLKQ